MARPFNEVENTGESSKDMHWTNQVSDTVGFKPDLLMSNPVLFSFSHNSNFVNTLNHHHNQL